MDCKNKHINAFVDDSAALLKPDRIVWIDGSQAQIDQLREEACATGEMVKLNQEKLPNCYYHRTAVNDVARVEDRTFICSREKVNAGAS
ncbi:MAG: phosphoenolpyruvate carboxykinase, partial [Firmicutes bacterium]|nr:phosphoenolpyruvate carboxykinase [Bacillota bacterium]